MKLFLGVARNKVDGLCGFANGGGEERHHATFQKIIYCSAVWTGAFWGRSCACFWVSGVPFTLAHADGGGFRTTGRVEGGD